MTITTPTLSWDQVLTWRMDRQYLLDRSASDLVDPVDPVDVVRRLCGVQAQVASAAALAVGVRLTPPRPRALAEAFEARTVIKTWAMRGTLHVLSADVAGAYLALLAASRRWEGPGWQKAFVSAPQLRALTDAVQELLDGRVLSREDLIGEVLRRTADDHLAEQMRSGWGTVLKPLAWQGLLCHGPGDGNRVSFTSPSTWVPDWRGLPSVEDAARVVLPAYFGAYGPASIATFDQWLTRGATSKTALRAWVAEAGDRLATVDVEGERLLARGEDVEDLASTRPTRSVRLLGAFDQYVLGPGTGDGHITPAARRPDVSRTSGWIAPVVVVGGRVAGTWATDTSTLDVTLFSEFEAAEPDVAALEAEAARISILLDKPLRLRVAPR